MALSYEHMAMPPGYSWTPIHFRRVLYFASDFSYWHTVSNTSHVHLFAVQPGNQSLQHIKKIGKKTKQKQQQQKN